MLAAVLPERIAEDAGVDAATIRAIAAKLVDVRPAVVCATLGATDDLAGTGAAVVKLQSLLDDLAGARSVALPLGAGNVQGLVRHGRGAGPAARRRPGHRRRGPAAPGRRLGRRLSARPSPAAPPARSSPAFRDGGVKTAWVWANEAASFGDSPTCSLPSRPPTSSSSRERSAAIWPSWPTWCCRPSPGVGGRHLHQRRAAHQPPAPGPAPGRRRASGLVGLPRGRQAARPRVARRLPQGGVGGRDHPAHPVALPASPGPRSRSTASAGRRPHRSRRDRSRRSGLSPRRPRAQAPSGAAVALWVARRAARVTRLCDRCTGQRLSPGRYGKASPKPPAHEGAMPCCAASPPSSTRTRSRRSRRSPRTWAPRPGVSCSPGRRGADRRRPDRPDQGARGQARRGAGRSEAVAGRREQPARRVLLAVHVQHDVDRGGELRRIPPAVAATYSLRSPSSGSSGTGSPAFALAAAAASWAAASWLPQSCAKPKPTTQAAAM